MARLPVAERRRGFRACASVSVLILGLVTTPLEVAGQESGSSMDSSGTRGPVDPAEVTAFLDGLMAAHMDDHDIAGATVAVVRDSNVLVLKGYGYADYEARMPVDPERTMFRVGSVSKLFTWTAVMQQVEAGTLDLDTDVNEYLDFAIPDTFEEPITLTHLLTHTPGFEDRSMGLFGETELSRRDYLAENIPSRVRPPGTFSAYSNYGTALAGHIVERVTDTRWEDYVRERILDPLGMEYATAHQPIPEEIAPYMSAGYSNPGGRFVAEDFEMIDWSAPAGSVSASAGAMAKLMIAYLKYGRYGDNRILDEATAGLMYERLFAHDERLPGFAHGFYEKNSHGLRIIGHGGDTQWFHTDLALVPEEHFGVFVSYNTSSGGELSFGPFLDLFLDHYYPADPIVSAEPIEADLQRYAGTYRFNRMSYTTFEKMMSLFSPISVAAGDSTLILDSPLGAEHYVPVDEGLFVERDGGYRISFREDDAGNVTHAFLGLAPMMVMERVSGLASPNLHIPLLIGAMVVFAITLLALPIRAYLRRKYSTVRQDTTGERRARWVAWITALSGVVFVIGLAVLMSDFSSVLMGSTGGLRVVLTFGALTGLLMLAVIAFCVLAWKDRYWTTWGRVRYTIFAAFAAIFVVVLNHWNLLGWRL